MSAPGVAWARDHMAREKAWAAWRWPDQQFGHLGVVVPTADEMRTARRAEMYMRSRPGSHLPMVRYVWVADLEHLSGATYRVRVAPPVPVILKTGRDVTDTFCTTVHELQHVMDAWIGGYSTDAMEERAEAAAERARRERWRW